MTLNDFYDFCKAYHVEIKLRYDPYLTVMCVEMHKYGNRRRLVFHKEELELVKDEEQFFRSVLDKLLISFN